ncbi:hypothetical protein [Pseudonocardia sp.]|uniref:hypothetical protein n=1 Tax=Pseudonocardia sp. TaxID=60912 RepID=UPI003D0CDAB0
MIGGGTLLAASVVAYLFTMILFCAAVGVLTGPGAPAVVAACLPALLISAGVILGAGAVWVVAVCLVQELRRRRRAGTLAVVAAASVSGPADPARAQETPVLADEENCVFCRGSRSVVVVLTFLVTVGTATAVHVTTPLMMH